MKTLRHWAWSLVLIGVASISTSSIQAAEDEGEDFLAPVGSFPCEPGSFCFIDGALSNGYRKVTLTECAARRQFLNAYGLAKQVSAWVNNSDWLIIVEDAYGNLLWRELPHTRSAGTQIQGDRAWSFRCLAD